MNNRHAAWQARPARGRRAERSRRRRAHRVAREPAEVLRDTTGERELLLGRRGCLGFVLLVRPGDANGHTRVEESELAEAGGLYSSEGERGARQEAEVGGSRGLGEERWN